MTHKGGKVPWPTDSPPARIILSKSNDDKKLDKIIRSHHFNQQVCKFLKVKNKKVKKLKKMF